VINRHFSTPLASFYVKISQFATINCINAVVFRNSTQKSKLFEMRAPLPSGKVRGKIIEIGKKIWYGIENTYVFLQKHGNEE